MVVFLKASVGVIGPQGILGVIVFHTHTLFFKKILFSSKVAKTKEGLKRFLSHHIEK